MTGGQTRVEPWGKPRDTGPPPPPFFEVPEPSDESQSDVGSDAPVANGSGNGNGIWKWVSAILMSVVMTGGGTYLATGKDTVHESDFRQEQAKTAALSDSLARLETDMGYVKQSLARLENKLDKIQ